MGFLEKEKIDAVLIFKNTHAFIQDKDRIYEETISKILKNPNVANYVIFNNQINRDDQSNLLAWAQTLDNVTKNNKVTKFYYFRFVIILIFALLSFFSNFIYLQ